MSGAGNSIEGEQISLTTLTAEDLRRFLNLSHDPVLLDTMGWKPFGPDERERFMQVAAVITVPGLVPGDQTLWAIRRNADGRAIGYVILKGRDDGKLTELGIAIMDRDGHGQGMGSEAVRLALGYAFGVMGLEKVRATVFPSNQRALGAFRKAGFEPLHRLSGAWSMPDGRKRNMLLLEATKKRWSRKPAPPINQPSLCRCDWSWPAQT